MPRRYAKEFRRSICARLVVGEQVRLLSEELGVSEATLFLWKRQALIDAGRSEGVKSFEVDELAQAHRTIADLEAELESVKAVPHAGRRRAGSSSPTRDCAPGASAVGGVLRPAGGRVLPLLLAAVGSEVEDVVDEQQPVDPPGIGGVGAVDLLAVGEEHVE